ncbi:MAG: hypothetical protein K8R88_02385, partial [Armatimonadetes bacterium]|nr:hypothetical protein [Armatimonadota bacterium]
LRILNKPILTIPYLVLPLNETGERVLPKVGHSRDEGYYILNRIATPLRGETYLNNRLDYFSKLGAGIGSDLHYSQGSMYGLARVYGIVGSVRSKLASIDHRMPLLGGKFALESVFQSSNYLTAPNTRTLIARSNFTRNTKQGNFRFTFNQNSSKSSNYDTLSSSFALSDQRTWSPRTRTNLDLNYATSQSSGFNNQGVKSKRLDLRFRGTEDLTKAELELLYQRAIPIGTQANFYAGSDQTPMLSLKSDARRMFGDRFSQQLPFTIGVSVAELRDNQAKRLTRSAFDWAMYKSNSAKNGSSFTYNARFKQGIYSDNTAQYVLALDGGYRYQIAPKSYFNWRHTYLQPEGFTPLNIDQSGKSNQSYLEIMTETRGGFRFGAQSGYDFRAADRKSVPWQSASLRLDYEPSKRFYVRTNSSYDTSRAKWQNIRLDSGIRVGEGFVTLGTRFDGDRHIWGNVNLYAEGLRFGKLKMSALASYNGYLKQFDSRHVSLIYDLHDAEAILQIIDNPTGFRKGTEIGFFIRLKVLPFDTPFGIGRRGQAIGSGTGHDF